MIEVVKVLNTSVILVTINGQELIALGKGIGFNKKPGDLIDATTVDRMYYSVNNAKVSTYMQYAETIPSIFFELTQEAVSYGEELLGVKLNSSVYFMLADHLNFAVERFNKGLQLSNRVLWEIQMYYPQEFRVGERLLGRLKETLDIQLPDEEAANIAFHIINARQDTDHTIDSTKAAQIINALVNIAKYSLQLDEADSMSHYQRFVTHLKFFVERVLQGKMLESEDSVLFNHIYRQYQEAVGIATKMERYLWDKHEVEITDEELLYLIIHINRLLEHC